MGSTHARHLPRLLGCALALALAFGAGCRSREDEPAQGTGTTAETATGAVPRATTDTAARRPGTPAPVFSDIAADLAPLRARFQEDDGRVRVIMLVAPT